MSRMPNKFAPEVRARAVRMVLDHAADHPSRWAAMASIAEKIGCSALTLNEWVKKAEVDSGKRAGVPAEMADRLKPCRIGAIFSLSAANDACIHWRLRIALSGHVPRRVFTKSRKA